MIVIILLVLVSWVALAAVVVGMFHIATGGPTPRLTPHAHVVGQDAPGAQAA